MGAINEIGYVDEPTEAFGPYLLYEKLGSGGMATVHRAKKRGIEVQERAIWPNELATFSEAFLTGSAAEITPIREIAGQTFKPSAMTEQLMHDFSALTRRKNAA